MFRIRKFAAVAATATLLALPATAGSAEAHDHLKFAHGLPECKYEDGSGNRPVCVWDVRHSGNGLGDLSILIRRGGTDDAVYKEITHRRAHRLIHRWQRFHTAAGMLA